MRTLACDGVQAKGTASTCANSSSYHAPLKHVKRQFGVKRETSVLIPGTIIFAGTMMSQLKVIDLTNSPCYLLTREEKN